jgi:uncharacterized membrane protein
MFRSRPYVRIDTRQRTRHGIRTIVIACLATAVIFFAMDFVWLSTAMGLVAYGTYDTTNLATMNGWSALVTGAAATAGHFIVRVV